MIGVSGCSTPPPAPVETAAAPPSPTATPDAEPVAESILISGLSFSIRFDSGEDEVFEYSSDPAAAISTLTEAFGAEPEITVYDEVNCGSPLTLTAWDGFGVTSDTKGLPPGQKFGVYAESPALLPVSTSNGSVLGEDNTAIIAATDDRLKSGWVYQGVSSADLFFDVQDLTSDEELYDNTGPVSDSDDGKFAWGGSSYSKAGVVERITAPVYYTDC